MTVNDDHLTASAAAISASIEAPPDPAALIASAFPGLADAIGTPNARGEQRLTGDQAVSVILAVVGALARRVDGAASKGDVDWIMAALGALDADRKALAAQVTTLTARVVALEKKPK